VQLLNIAASRKRDVIFFGAPFLVLFWRSKKEQEKSKLILFLLLPFVFSFFFFCLDTKETKNQGEPERLRPFRPPAPLDQNASKKSLYWIYRVSIVF